MQLAQRQTVGIFEALKEEHDNVIDEIEGVVPQGLSGTLYRNGPGRLEAGGQPLGHIFDGDGMLSMFIIDDGQIRFRNRYVRTNHFTGSKGTSGVAQRGFGTLKPGGPLANALRLPANVANTSVVYHAGELLALWEGGKPHRLDPDTLETRGVENFDGKLRWLGAFSAHPKVDPKTGELFNFGIDIIPRPQLRCYRVSPTGHMDQIGSVPLPEPVFNHDVALTERHMVFVIDPIGVALRELPGVALGIKSFDRALRFNASRGSTIALMPRNGGKPRVLQTEALLHFHVNNAYEDGDDTVVDLVRWDQDWALINDSLRSVSIDDSPTPEEWAFGGFLTRLRITKSGRVLREELSDIPGEFPRFDDRRGCHEHRYTYFAGRKGEADVANVIVKVDHAGAEDRVHELPSDHTVSEPIFVPRSDDAAEDDGWLLAVAYDPSEHRSRLLVLDAEDPRRDPICVAHLRHHVPQSFHGTFISRVAKP